MSLKYTSFESENYQYIVNLFRFSFPKTDLSIPLRIKHKIKLYYISIKYITYIHILFKYPHEIRDNNTA